MSKASAQVFDQRFDVIVVGSEPEGISAAVAAAQEGASTLLITQDAKLGGLFVMGQMNSLDLKTQPFLYHRGLFLDWWQRVGRAGAFDVVRAEAAFEAMLDEAGVTVLRTGEAVQPLVFDGRVLGVKIAEQTLYSWTVIDATSEADIAAAAGAPFSIGFASLGYEERMVDTLVFRINGIDWPALQQGIKARGMAYAQANEHVAWGHFGGIPAAYQAEEAGIRLRGLNLGRQDDGSVLVNALLIYGIDPFDEASVAEGFARAEREAPRIIAYLKTQLPGFGQVSFGGVADKLYIRETRHINTLCTLTIDDVMNNVVTERDIAAGGYPLDVQSLTPYDHGFVFGSPEVYGARLCMTVPGRVEHLWVVGKAAGFDPLAASSARVVPFGMTVAEAVGVAAAQAAQLELSPKAMAIGLEHINSVRQRLENRGAYLPRVEQRSLLGPYEHPHYDSYRLMLSRGLALGGYNNDPKLDEPMSAIGYVYLLSNVGKRFLDDDRLGEKLVSQFNGLQEPLLSHHALAITVSAACELGLCLSANWDALQAYNLAPFVLPENRPLSRGEMYALAAGIAEMNGTLNGQSLTETR